MDERQLRSDLISLLQRVAPEVDPGELDAAEPLRRQVDLDSIDFLNFLISINRQFKVSIPESDYEKLRSLDDIVSYLLKAMPAPSGGSGKASTSAV